MVLNLEYTTYYYKQWTPMHYQPDNGNNQYHYQLDNGRPLCAMQYLPFKRKVA